MGFKQKKNKKKVPKKSEIWDKMADFPLFYRHFTCIEQNLTRLQKKMLFISVPIAK